MYKVINDRIGINIFSFLSCVPQKSQIHTATSSHHQQEDQHQRQQGCVDESIQAKIHIAYILLVCFIAEHNLPFLIADHLTDLCKSIFPDSAIAQGLHMKRTRCTDIVKKLGNVM